MPTASFAPPTLAVALDETVQMLRYAGIEYTKALEKFRHEWLLQELQAAGGNQCVAARELHMHRNTLARQCKSVGLVWRGQIRYTKQARARKGNEATRRGCESVRKGGHGESLEPLPAPKYPRSSGKDGFVAGSVKKPALSLPKGPLSPPSPFTTPNALISCGRLTEETA